MIPSVLANYTHAIISPYSNFQVFQIPNRSVLLSVERNGDIDPNPIGHPPWLVSSNHKSKFNRAPNFLGNIFLVVEFSFFVFVTHRFKTKSKSIGLKVSVIPVTERLGTARLGYPLAIGICGKSVQVKGNIERVIMAGMVHEIGVAIQRRKHQTIGRLNILEHRRRDGQCLSHVIATRREKAAAEIIGVLEVGRCIVHIGRCQ